MTEVKNESGEKEKQPSVLACLKSLLVNRYWMIMVVFLFCLYFMMSTFFGSNYYFAQYVLGDEAAFASISNALSIAQIAIMFVTPFIMKKIGKRYTALIGMALGAVDFLITSLAGNNVMLVIASNALKGAAFGCSGAVMYGLLQDSITYSSWLTGVQAIGMGNAASS